MPTTQIISPHIDAILAALQHQGDSNDCGPYTTATVLNALLDLNLLKQTLPKRKTLMPIIGSINPLWAHLMTLVAWDPHKGWGFANTQSSRQNIHWVTDSYFTSHWNVMVHLLIEAT